MQAIVTTRALRARPRGTPGGLAPPARRLARRSAVLLGLGALPLVALVVGLALVQFGAQRAAELRELSRLAGERRLAIEGVVRAADDHVIALRRQAEWAADAPVPSPLRAALGRETRASGVDGAFLEARALPIRPGEDANLFGLPELLDGDRAAEVDLALDLVPAMNLAQGVTPFLRWSYYFSGREDLVVLAPFVPGEAVVEGAGFLSMPDLLAYWFDYELFRAAAPERNPGRASVWTAPYPDAAGAGLMVSHTAPVWDGDRFLGVVGTDVLLAALSRRLAEVPLPAGRMAVVDREGNLVAQAGGRSLPADAVHGIEDWLPASLRGVERAEVLGAGEALERVGGAYVLAQPVAAVPWRLLYVVDPGEVNALLLPRFVPYGVILLGLLGTLGAGLLLVHRSFVRPTIALVDHIQGEAAGQGRAMPRLPRAWAPWARAISEAFARRKAAEDALRASDERYRAVVELQTEFVDRVEPSGRLTFANEAWCRFMGIDREAALRTGANVFDRLPPEERETVRAHWARLSPKDPVITIERRSLGPDGSERWVQWNDRGVFDTDGRLVEIQGVGRDVTERVLAERAVKDREERFRLIAEGVPLPVFIMAAEGFAILFSNTLGGETFGPWEGQAMRPTLFVDPAAFGRIVARLREDGRLDGFEAELRREDGTPFWALISATPLLYDGVASLLTTVTDITRHRSLEDALRQSEKMAALGSLVAGVAHELNNPLAVVVMQAALMEETTADARTAERARQIQLAAQRCDRIVKSLLSVVRQKPPEPAALEIEPLVATAVDLTVYGLRAQGIDLTVEVEPGLPPIRGDADQLGQVLMNLLVNARQALEGWEGPRRVTLTARADGPGWLRIAVGDSGPGVPEAIRARVWDPFFTTKATGTGIGLALCQGIARAHGGTLSVEDAPEGGALFVLRLPCGAVGEAAAPAPEPVVPEGLRILVVDDEAAVAALVGEVLAPGAARLDRAGDGREALERLAEGPYDLILSDIRMPGLDGPGLWRALRERGFGGRVLFMTGDTLSGDVRRFLEESGVPVIEKPFGPLELKRRVAEAMGSL